MTAVHASTASLLFFLVPAICSDAVAQDGAQAGTEEAIRHEGISGLIVDNTVTFIGRQFYDAFALAWLDQGVADGQNLSVHEQPTAKSGSRVWVEYNRQKLFQVFLPPIRANIEETAGRAAASVARRFKTLEVERALFRNPDLAPDEF